jgi:hypothetical protein
VQGKIEVCEQVDQCGTWIQDAKEKEYDPALSHDLQGLLTDEQPLEAIER